MSTKSSVYKQGKEDFSEELSVFWEPGIYCPSEGFYINARNQDGDVLIKIEDPKKLAAELQRQIDCAR